MISEIQRQAMPWNLLHEMRSRKP